MSSLMAFMALGERKESMASLTFLFKQDNFVDLPYACLGSEIKPIRNEKKGKGAKWEPYL